MPYFLSSRNEFSVGASHRPAPPEKPSGSGNHIAKFMLGSVAVGAAVMAAYQAGYIGQHHVKEDYSSPESSKFSTDKKLYDVKHLEDHVVTPSHRNLNGTTLEADDVKKSNTHSGSQDLKDLQSNKEGDSHMQGELEMAPAEEVIPDEEKELPNPLPSGIAPDYQTNHSEAAIVDNNLEREKYEDSTTHLTSSMEREGLHSNVPSEEPVTQATSLHQQTSSDMPKDAPVNEMESPSSLSDAYFLGGKDDENSEVVSLNGEVASVFEPFSEEKEALEMKKRVKDVDIPKDEKMILGFIEAIHAAERRQAELDARIYAEEKRIMKEKYEKELKDARARELMYAEEAALLDKELNKERAKAVTTIKSLKEKAEENLKMELQRKEEAAQLELEKAHELAKAELAAAIATEKASQIEKMAEANLNINALCMAFYARSEEARQSHSAHKLALGSLALEDALSKGLPIQREINALYSSFDGIGGDSLLDLAFLSLPKETLSHGTDTLLQLNQKFDTLKGTLRHFSLIPSGGGGILAHTVAHIASSIKLRETSQSGEGIESVISSVESFLAAGKLAEAADALEVGVCGSKAEEIVVDWVRQARNRAIMEQAFSLLQSYATSISLT